MTLLPLTLAFLAGAILTLCLIVPRMIRATDAAAEARSVRDDVLQQQWQLRLARRRSVLRRLEERKARMAMVQELGELRATYCPVIKVPGEDRLKRMGIR